MRAADGAPVSPEPVLLFLHGVGTGDQDDAWRGALDRSLREVGYPGLDGIHVLAPKYPNALRGVDDKMDVPELTIRVPTGQAAKTNRLEFQRRQGAVEIRMVRHDAGTGWAGPEGAAAAALKAPAFVQAKNYLSHAHIRAFVLNRILERLPEAGRLVIVGHSLGSVIAADLVRRLPPRLEVVGMVTIGSPLPSTSFDIGGIRKALKEPPTNLGWWVNFWNIADPVTTHRGLSSVLPWIVDHRVRTHVGLGVHAATTYLSDRNVATAIGFGLHGSTSRELVVAETGLEIPLDYAETIALVALRAAHLTSTKLSGERQARFATALRQVQATTVDRIAQRNADEGRTMPSAIAALRVDLTDPGSVAPEPRRIHHLSKEDAVVMLTSLVATNVIRPFEIDVPDEVRREVFEDLTVEMGLGRQFGRDVVSAAEEASRALTGSNINWVKWVALGVGAAAVAATGGLAAAAAPAGLAGAAAITSALAAFGPGGMVGGLLTAGALVSAGSGGLAIGLANPTTSADTVEAVVAAQLTAEILRFRQKLDADPTVWADLIETSTEVRREQARLTVISDEGSPLLKDLDVKLEVTDRALRHLSARGLDPNGDPDLIPTEDASGSGLAQSGLLHRAADAFRTVDIDGDGIPDRPRAAVAIDEARAALRSRTYDLLRRRRAEGGPEGGTETDRPDQT
ncbi:hypothetical protein [Nocardioides faecalis]|uniref:hypothetical protein n=1 Tax=Nocardioides faecalis TaxID=2803858 RepID=UPI001BCEB5E9|nr:hypothetical protein [Nocardioides faecalis]MBS4754248.1 hypothetical protein [Nocardioides faecalis]QVI60056.1 hypothetical protein KG111_07050 [Nocardioides faecalis]